MGLATAASAQKGKPAMSPDEAKAKQAYALGVQAYLWGYPMVVMQKSREAMTSSDHAVTPEEFAKTGKIVGPVNQVANAWEMLGPNFSAVQSVNSDTLYEIIWCDSTRGTVHIAYPGHQGTVLHLSVHRRLDE